MQRSQGLSLRTITCVFATVALFTPTAHSLTVSDAVQTTLEQHPDVLANVAQSRSREEEIVQAKAGYQPTIDIRVGGGVEWSDNTSTQASGKGGRVLRRRESAIRLNQMLYDGDATKSEIETSSARVDASVFNTHGVMESVSLQAAQAYVNMVRHIQLVGFAQTNISAHRELARRVALSQKSGLSNKAQVAQAEGRLALAASNLSASEGALEDARARYLRVVGALPPNSGIVEPDAPMGPLDDPNAPTHPASTLDELTAIAVQNNPRLKAVGANIEAAQAQRRMADSFFRPRIDLEIGASFNDNLDGREREDNDLSAMLQLRYNLYRGGRDESRRRQAAHLVAEAKHVRDSAQREIVEAVRLAWAALESVKAQYPQLLNHQEASREVRNAYDKQFTLGKRTLLDRLDAENEFFESQRAATNARLDGLIRQYQILATLGQLREELGVQVETVSRLSPNN